MKTGGRPRREVLIRLATDGPKPRVDVGADHARVATALGCVATERQPHRAALQRPGPWVICDGLRAFRSVGTAIIAGMGAHTIARILAEAPPVERVVLHAQDDPPRLRLWLAQNGWTLRDEALAPEAGRFAEVVVAERGRETTTGWRLEYGPRLLEGQDPWLLDHLQQLRGHLDRLAGMSERSRTVHEDFCQRRDFIDTAIHQARLRGLRPMGYREAPSER